jgi:hypothetical protein
VAVILLALLVLLALSTAGIVPLFGNMLAGNGHVPSLWSGLSL